MRLIKEFGLEERVRFVERYNAGENAQDIAKSINASRASIARFLSREPSAKWRGRRTFEFNQNYFSQIDSEEKAYFLGFIYADGYNCPNKHTRYMQIEIQCRDDYILKQFASMLQYKGSIGTTYHKSSHSSIKKPYSRLRVFSKILSEDLLKLGVSGDKTRELQWPKFLDKSFIGPFLRGLSDGDGYIRSDFEATIKRYGWCMVSSLSMCNSLQIFLHTLGVSSQVEQKASKIDKNLIYGRIMISGGTNVEKFLRFIYADSTIHLTRKYESFQKLLVSKSLHNRDTYKKITLQQAKEIKQRLANGNETMRQIAKDYGISHGPVSSIKNGHSWKNA